MKNTTSVFCQFPISAVKLLDSFIRPSTPRMHHAASQGNLRLPDSTWLGGILRDTNVLTRFENTLVRVRDLTKSVETPCTEILLLGKIEVHIHRPCLPAQASDLNICFVPLTINSMESNSVRKKIFIIPTRITFTFCLLL